MKNFEKEAKDQLDQYKSSMEINPLWDKINMELRPVRLHRGFFWWTIGTGLALLFLVILINSNKSDFKQDKSSVNLEANSKEANALIKNDFEPTSKRRSSIIVKEATGFKVNQKAIINSGTNYIAGNKRSYDPENSSHTRPRSINGTHSETNKAFSSNSNSSHFESPSIIPESNNILASPSIDAEELFIQSTNERDDLDQLETKLLSVYFNKQDYFPSQFMAGFLSPKVKKKFILYAGFYGGYGYPSKSLEAKTNKDKMYESTRSETETILEEYQFGAYIGSKHHTGLFLESGFEYNRINERFDWNKTITDTIGQYLVSGWVINFPGDTTFIKDSVDVVRISKYNKSINNNYSFYSIPVTIGYEFNSMSRTRFYVKGGVLVNLRLKHKVEILDEEGLPSRYNSTDSESGNPFKSKIGITPFISLGAKYRLSSMIDLFGELNYKHLSDVTEESYGVSQKYNLFSINVGLQLGF